MEESTPISNCVDSHVTDQESSQNVYQADNHVSDQGVSHGTYKADKDATAQASNEETHEIKNNAGDEDTSRNPYNVDVHRSSQEAIQNLESEKDQTSSVPFNFNKFSAPRKCFKLNYQQPLGLNAPSILVAGLEDMGVKYLIMSALLCLYLGQAEYGLLSLVLTSMTGKNKKSKLKKLHIFKHCK